MLDTNITSNDDTSLFDIGTQQSYAIQFWIFLFLIIPSMIFAFFALYHLLRERALRQALHNHIIIILLIINLFYQMTDMCFFIHYFRTYQSFMPTPTFRLFWGYIDWSIYAVQSFLYAWVTIERHILIFHDHLLSTRKKRLFIHYLPPVIITIYPLLYYAIVHFVPTCENTFDNLTTPGFFPCQFSDAVFGTYEIVADAIIPCFTIVISSVALLFRAVWQRYHMHRQIQWRQYRKMTLQVIIISTIYLILPFPYMMITFLHLCGMPAEIGAEFLSRTMFFTYYTLFLFPIVSVGALSELREKVKNIIRFRRQRRMVGTLNSTRAHMTNNRVFLR
ncbi:unnamed protein product [Adineta steineri]|uniref:G-protein coupled receptors family 1 profile domain-containing protein n=1 Tax=Adineta steineri TaxID=433720 RepID=A0A818XVA5_9BILA|nr:unnamed protein product [Adineta steineri]CAF1170566.1 unnamed protein product [Adineta steineri]CAF3741994.1 unnamed protein product [Adineta steineri]CAF3976590.1 unnamed protein product [Adineta steineri]